MRSGCDLVATNLHRNYTGVSATAAAVIKSQAGRYRMLLAGRALPGCMPPVPLRRAFRCSRSPAPGRKFVLWHVRRNNEIRAALLARDILKLPVRIIFTSAAQRRHSAVPRWLISQADAVIATTEEAAAFVPNVHAVVHHGVQNDSVRQKTGLLLGSSGIIRASSGSPRSVEFGLRRELTYSLRR